MYQLYQSYKKYLSDFCRHLSPENQSNPLSLCLLLWALLVFATFQELLPNLYNITETYYVQRVTEVKNTVKLGYNELGY